METVTDVDEASVDGDEVAAAVGTMDGAASMGTVRVLVLVLPQVSVANVSDGGGEIGMIGVPKPKRHESHRSISPGAPLSSSSPSLLQSGYSNLGARRTP